ncbi:MAG: HEAT repeat domain-containing protein [Nitrospirae bacterium]|nr:HEAT repeat domain-containing protein [Nitrospirota bacterium]
MAGRHEQGQGNLTALVVLIGLIVAGVWIWKRLTPETQDYVIDQAIPIAAVVLIVLTVLAMFWRALRRRQFKRQERGRLLTLFGHETALDKKLELAFAMIEVNDYHVEGLESAVPALKDLFVTTLQRALGDKQHRIRGMAASHLGALQDMSVVPLLVKALEDDHAYVRSCAALGLGRLRATETRERLAKVMEEDWDQTVRSRAKEALEQMRV